MDPKLTLDSDFPGGNIIVDAIDGDVVSLRQDLRDTNGHWFYWAFRLRGAAGRRLTFRFTAGDVIGTRGPAVSWDGGANWRWLGDACVTRSESGAVVTCDVPADAPEAFLAFCPTYTQEHLDAFLAKHAIASAPLQRGVFCRSNGGRPVVQLSLPNPGAPLGLLLTARHHACETMGSYCLEGMLAAVVAEDEVGRWMRANVDLAVVPFIDTDGVAAGDQGKNRRPYDHNRDYGGPAATDSIYSEVRTMRQWVPDWLSRHRTNAFFDIHCPWIRGGRNEQVFFVGVPNETIWRNVTAYSQVLEQHRVGPLRYEERNNLPYGQEWNVVGGDAIGGRTSTKWACSLPGIHLAAGLEVPYANADDVDVTPDAARALGRDLIVAFQRYARSSLV